MESFTRPFAFLELMLIIISRRTRFPYRPWSCRRKVEKIRAVKKKVTRLDSNVVNEFDTPLGYYYRNDPRRMQHRVSYRPVKGKIHGNLFDHKQTLGYTGHWAVLSERRSNTVNTCAWAACMCARASAMRWVRCERANERCTEPPLLSSPTSIFSSSPQHAAISRVATSTWTACVLSHLHTPKRANARTSVHA